MNNTVIQDEENRDDERPDENEIPVRETSDATEAPEEFELDDEDDDELDDIDLDDGEDDDLGVGDDSE